MMRAIAYSCLFSAFFAYGQSSDAPRGSICGTVLEENGAPAQFVKVVAMYMGAHSGGVPVFTTDKSGHYCATNLAVGDYFMTADDPAKGYPEMNSYFSSAHPDGPRVSITAENLRGRADWRIPYKAGFLAVELTGARTGKPVDPMFYSLSVRSRPGVGAMYGSGPSAMTMLLSPNEDIYFIVSAPGYQEWPGDGSRGKLVNVRSGQTEHLAIALQPANP